MKSIKRVFYALVLVLTFVFPAASALGKTMKETVIQAVLTNPDVQAAWHAFRAAQAEQEAARGGYLPKVDVAVSAGWENLGGKAYRNRDQHNYFREGAYLTLSQMIYDGGMTRSQAKKFGYAKNAKYYDLLSSIEKVALLAFRSHDDVNRYREMIRLAQLNLKRHEEIMKKVEARSRAGIDKLGRHRYRDGTDRPGSGQPDHRGGQPARRLHTVLPHRRGDAGRNVATRRARRLQPS